MCLSVWLFLFILINILWLYIWWFISFIDSENDSVIISLNITLPFSLFSSFETSLTYMLTNLKLHSIFLNFFLHSTLAIFSLLCYSLIIISTAIVIISHPKCITSFSFIDNIFNFQDFYLVFLNLNSFLIHIHLFIFIIFYDDFWMLFLPLSLQID